MRRRVDRFGHKLVPGVWEYAAFSGDRAEQTIQHEKTARDRPAVTDAGRNTAPVMTTQFCSRGSNQFRDLFDCLYINTGLPGSEIECIFGVEFFQSTIKFFKRGF